MKRHVYEMIIGLFLFTDHYAHTGQGDVNPQQSASPSLPPISSLSSVHQGRGGG